ncbi:MAG: hypothetical protein GX492_05590 [Firmicutes bacterium]|nr:hypothetical protein [Bacillota bacterium]
MLRGRRRRRHAAYRTLERAQPEMAKELADQVAGACGLALAWQGVEISPLARG